MSASENGLINGAADTVRTLSTAVGFPLMAGIFGYFISDKAPLGVDKYHGACVHVCVHLGRETWVELRHAFCRGLTCDGRAIKVPLLSL